MAIRTSPLAGANASPGPGIELTVIAGPQAHDRVRVLDHCALPTGGRNVEGEAALDARRIDGCALSDIQER